VKLHCVSARLRLGDVPTYYPVNSWLSRSSSCEESLFPSFHTQIVVFKIASAQLMMLKHAFGDFNKNFHVPRPTNFAVVKPFRVCGYVFRGVKIDFFYLSKKGRSRSPPTFVLRQLAKRKIKNSLLHICETM
jgi:hypothetical protein